MSELWELIVSMSVTAGVSAAVIIAVRFAIRRLPKKYSYWSWSVVLFRMICPISFSSIFSFFGLLGLFSRNSQQIGAGGIENVGNIGNIGDIPATPVQNVPITPVAPVQPILTEQTNVTVAVDPIGIAAGIWVAVAILLVGYLVVSYVRVYRKIRFATRMAGQDNVYESDRISSPFVFGLIHPKIYLPKTIEPDALDYVIAHEKVHIKRGDFLIKPLCFLALCLHWFNPLLWVSYYLMIKDMEMSCDEAVMHKADTDSLENVRAGYSRTLLDMAVKQSGIVGPIAFGESDVKLRIKNILNYRKPMFWTTIAAVVVIAVVAFALTANPAAKKQEIPYAECTLENLVENGTSPTLGITLGDKAKDFRLKSVNRKEYYLMRGNVNDNLRFYFNGEDGGFSGFAAEGDGDFFGWELGVAHIADFQAAFGVHENVEVVDEKSYYHFYWERVDRSDRAIVEFDENGIIHSISYELLDYLFVSEMIEDFPEDVTGSEFGNLDEVEIEEFDFAGYGITFPSNSNNSENDFNGALGCVPFEMRIALPNGWSILQDNDGRVSMFSGNVEQSDVPLPSEYVFSENLGGKLFSSIELLDENNQPVGTIAYNIYSEYPGAEKRPEAIYSDLTLERMYNFNVHGTYSPVRTEDNFQSATVDVVTSQGELGAEMEERYSKGILAYNSDLLVYVAIELSRDVPNEQYLAIANSISISGNGSLSLAPSAGEYRTVGELLGDYAYTQTSYAIDNNGMTYSIYVYDTMAKFLSNHREKPLLAVTDLSDLKPESSIRFVGERFHADLVFVKSEGGGKYVYLPEVGSAFDVSNSKFFDVMYKYGDDSDIPMVETREDFHRVLDGMMEIYDISYTEDKDTGREAISTQTSDIEKLLNLFWRMGIPDEWYTFVTDVTTDLRKDLVDSIFGTTGSTAKFTLYSTDNTPNVSLVVEKEGKDHFAAQIGEVLGYFTFVEITDPQNLPDFKRLLDGAKYYLVIESPDGSVRYTFYDIGQDVLMQKGSDAKWYYAFSNFGLVGIRVRQLFDYYEWTRSNADERFAFSGNAEGAAEYYAHTYIKECSDKLTEGNIFRLEDYAVMDWGVREVSSDGNMVVAWCENAKLFAEKSLRNVNVWAGSASDGEGEYEGWVTYHTEYLLAKTSDGYWEVVKKGTGGVSLP